MYLYFITLLQVTMMNFEEIFDVEVERPQQPQLLKSDCIICSNTYEQSSEECCFVITSCNHVMCVVCAFRLASRSRNRLECPFCRQDITRFYGCTNTKTVYVNFKVKSPRTVVAERLYNNYINIINESNIDRVDSPLDNDALNNMIAVMEREKEEANNEIDRLKREIEDSKQILTNEINRLKQELEENQTSKVILVKANTNLTNRVEQLTNTNNEYKDLITSQNDQLLSKLNEVNDITMDLANSTKSKIKLIEEIQSLKIQIDEQNKKFETEFEKFRDEQEKIFEEKLREINDNAEEARHSHRDYLLLKKRHYTIKQKYINQTYIIKSLAESLRRTNKKRK
uniref:Pe38 n=1 Tax=Cryptophlebia leucotreta granulosis virus TaxID=35254 RepID=A0A2H4ZKB0_GVCL|nr:pe38 [Cryptophlebia leucotreta granulovirus]